MLSKLTNIIYVPFVIAGAVLLGAVAELSYWIHNETGLSFWLSMLLGTAVLYILVLAAVSTFKFIRNVSVTAVRTYARSRQAQAVNDNDPSNTESDQ